MLNYVFDAPSLASGRYQMLRDFNVSALTAEAGVGGAFPGMTFYFQGNLYQVVQNRSGGALARGDAVSIYVGGADRTGNLVTGSTKAVLLTDDTLDIGMAGARDWPGYVATTAGVLATTDDMERHEVLDNSTDAGASTITIAKYNRELGPTYAAATSSADALSTTPDNTYDYEIVSPWEVVKTDLGALATSLCQGVTVTTSITDNYFGIIQVKGLAIAKVDGTTDLVAGDLLIPYTTAGVLAKWVVTNLDPTIAQVNQAIYVCGRIFNAFTDNAAGLRTIQLFGKTAVYPQPTF